MAKKRICNAVIKTVGPVRSKYPWRLDTIKFEINPPSGSRRIGDMIGIDDYTGQTVRLSNLRVVMYVRSLRTLRDYINSVLRAYAGRPRKPRGRR